jgi:hypothetical protein
MCEYHKHEDGAGALAGLARFMASESTGVKTSVCCAPDVPVTRLQATQR